MLLLINRWEFNSLPTIAADKRKHSKGDWFDKYLTKYEHLVAEFKENDGIEGIKKDLSDVIKAQLRADARADVAEEIEDSQQRERITKMMQKHKKSKKKTKNNKSANRKEHRHKHKGGTGNTRQKTSKAKFSYNLACKTFAFEKGTL